MTVTVRNGRGSSQRHTKIVAAGISHCDHELILVPDGPGTAVVRIKDYTSVTFTKAKAER